VQEKQSVTASVYLSSAITLGTALQFQKPKTKGRQIWPPPWAAKGPATPLVQQNSQMIHRSTRETANSLIMSNYANYV